MFIEGTSWGGVSWGCIWGVGWGTCGGGGGGTCGEGGVRGVGGLIFCDFFLKSQKPVAYKKNWKELKRQTIRAKIEQKSNKI